MLVKNRETYYVTVTFDATAQFTKFLDLIEGDEIRVVQCIYAGAPAVDTVRRVVWDGVTDCLLLFDSNHQNSNINTRIKIHGKKIRGVQQFSVFNVDGTPSTDLVGEFGFIFEVVKYYEPAN